MKKLTILLALVAACGIASAAVSWAPDQVDESATSIDLTLSSDFDARAVSIEGIQADIDGSWSLSSLDAGFDANRNEGIESGGVFYNVGGSAGAAAGVSAGELATLMFTPDGALTAGETVNFSFVTLSSGNYVMDLQDNQEALTGFGVDVVPEPMTMALLGLGGLFVRRRSA